MLEIDKKAPSFSLKDSENKTRTLKEFLGKKVILYFYPKGNTSGCTKEACDFRDKFPKFNNSDAIVIGISPDSVESHKKFALKFELPFILLSDEKKRNIGKIWCVERKKYVW